MVVACCLARSKDRSLPDLSTAVGIEGIDTVMFGGNVQHITQLTADSHVGKIKRLGVHLSIDRVEANLAELSGVHVGLCQDRLLRIEPVPRHVVVIGGHIQRIGHRRGLYCQSEGRGMRDAA